MEADEPLPDYWPGQILLCILYGRGPELDPPVEGFDAEGKPTKMRDHAVERVKFVRWAKTPGTAVVLCGGDFSEEVWVPAHCLYPENSI